MLAFPEKFFSLLFFYQIDPKFQSILNFITLCMYVVKFSYGMCLWLCSSLSLSYMDGFQLLGEQLYPLVERIEGDHAGKVTGMLLEMDQTEVLHLIESPEALKQKVSQALEVLHRVQATGSDTADQLSSLTLND